MGLFYEVIKMEWNIEFYYDKNLDPVFIHKFFYFLVSRGIKYNSVYEGNYIYFPEIPNKHMRFEEKEVKESTEKLAEIIDGYLKYNIKTTLLSIYLDYFGDVNFHFYVTIAPEDGQCLISLESNTYAIPDDRTFFAFINLCKEVFVKFNFVYGAFRTEHHDHIPLNVDDFLKISPLIVDFYSKALVEKIGREKLLSAPAFKVEELENSGVMLLICLNPAGCPKERYNVLHHLGYSG